MCDINGCDALRTQIKANQVALEVCQPNASTFPEIAYEIAISFDGTKYGATLLGFKAEGDPQTRVFHWVEGADSQLAALRKLLLATCEEWEKRLTYMRPHPSVETKAYGE